MKTRIQTKVKTRSEIKVFLGVVTGCNLDHIGVARVYSKYAWTIAWSYGTWRDCMNDGEAVGNINNVGT